MGLVDDDRGQAIQVGAVLLFGILIVAFASYQAVVVPDQNRRVEFNHNQQVQSQLQDVRNTIVSVVGGGAGGSVSVDLGTQYPGRAVALNPGAPSGSLRTVGTDDPAVTLTIDNATAVADAETGDVWNGSLRRYDTGGLVYTPNYNVYTNPPRTVYEHTVVYNRFDTGNLTATNQSLVRGETVSLVTLNGSLSRTAAGATSLDVEPLSSSTRTVRVESTVAAPIRINLTTRLPADRWETLLSGQEAVDDVTDVGNAPADYRRVRVTLAPGDYTLRMTKVGVGTRTTDEPATYLTGVAGDGSQVSKGENVEVIVEARDAYNNPESGVTVNASVAGTGTGTLDTDNETTNGEGRASFVYETDDGTATDLQQLQFGLGEVGTDFDGSTGENVTVNVTVSEPATPEAEGGGGNATALAWRAPTLDNPTGPLSTDCADPEAVCVWDVGDDGDTTLDLSAELPGAYEGVWIDFYGNNSTVGTPNPTTDDTDGDGIARTALDGAANGTVSVLATGAGADEIVVEVTNVSTGGTGTGTGTGTESPSGSAEAFRDVNQNNRFDPGTDSKIDKSALEGSFSTNAGEGLVVPASVGSFDTTTIDWEADGVYVGADVTSDTDVSISGRSGTVNVTGRSVTADGRINVSGGTVEADGVSVDSYRNTNADDRPVVFNASSGPLSASGAEVDATKNVVLRGEGVDASDSNLDNYQNTNGGGSIEIDAGSGTADVDGGTVRSLNGINVTGTDVSAVGTSLDNYVNSNRNGRPIRLVATGGAVDATGDTSVDTAGDIVVSGDSVDVSGAGLDNYQTSNGEGTIDVIATGATTATGTTFDSASEINVTGGSTDVTDATLDNFQSGNGNGVPVRIEATAGAVTGERVDVDSGQRILVNGTSMTLTDADLDNFQSSNGEGDIALRASGGDIRIEGIRMSTNEELLAYGTDTAGPDLFVQGAEFRQPYKGNSNGYQLKNVNGVDVDGSPAVGKVT